jgi:hypothetical protein
MACPKMPTNPTVDDLSDAIECLQKEIADLEPAINNATSAANKFGGSIGESNNLLGDMKKKFVGINKASLEFVRSTGNQYKLAVKNLKGLLLWYLGLGVRWVMLVRFMISLQIFQVGLEF